MATWTAIGSIILLQSQTHAMTGSGGYDTGALRSNPVLKLTASGAYGLDDGAWVMDRHHRHHPESQYWHAEDVLSFGFTSHYRHMTSLFGPIPLGIGGENVIVECSSIVTLEDIAGGIRIEGQSGSLDLTGPAVAEPCVEFTRFMTQKPAASAHEIKPYREQLKHGVRGFVVGVPDGAPFDVAVGDTVWRRSDLA
ncbi:MAG: hypothetical protein ACR2N7_01870 [Acidimicrobiia bacterium]